MSSKHTLIAATAAHALLMFTGYFGLVAVFDFPDVLRTEPSHILHMFRDQRALVQAFYAAFTWSQVAFVCLVLSLRERLGDPDAPLVRAATHLGVIAGFAQAVGFARWPFVVSSLADRYEQAPEVVLTVLDTLHNFAGVAVGEHLFFCFEALWAIATGLHLLSRPQGVHVSTPAAWLLIAVGGAIGVYSLEQFGGPFAVLGPLNIYAHGALLFWLIGLALTEATGRALRHWEVGGLLLLWAATVMG